MTSVEACREDGYNVSTMVPDCAGNVQVALRGSLAARHTLEISEHKPGMTMNVEEQLKFAM